jgi:hypothetical protein
MWQSGKALDIFSLGSLLFPLSPMAWLQTLADWSSAMHFGPALCSIELHHGPTLCRIAQNHGLVLCHIEQDLCTNSIEKKSSAMQHRGGAWFSVGWSLNYESS